MKHIKIYINEKLHITSKSHIRYYTCQPTTMYELQQIIIQRIQEDGPDCDLNDIDVSKIIDMSHLFGANIYKIFKDFNGDISQWDVSNVKYMYSMFSYCEKFNCDISKWDVSNVKKMEYIFYKCKKFNCNINGWDVSNVKYMTNAFKDCPTQPKWYDKNKYETQ